MISGNIEQAMISQSTAALAPEAQPRQRVRRNDAEQQGQDRRRAGHDQRVDQRPAEVVRRPAKTPL